MDPLPYHKVEYNPKIVKNQDPPPLDKINQTWNPPKNTPTGFYSNIILMMTTSFLSLQITLVVTQPTLNIILN